MTYYLNSDVSKIKSPIVLNINEQELHFKNGKALAEYEFDKKYEIVSIKAVDSAIHAKVKEKSLLPTEDWTKKEISFF